MVVYSKGSRRKSASCYCILLSALGLVALGGCHRLYEVRALPLEPEPSKPPPEGVVYVLPQTELVMDVDIEQTVLTLGRFAEFAEKFGLTPTKAHRCPDGKLGEKESDRLYTYTCTPRIESAKLNAVAVPDRNQRFHVRIISERKAVDRSLDFTLSEDARITKGKAEVYDRSAEVGLRVTSKVLEIAAKVAGAFFGVSRVEEITCKCEVGGSTDCNKTKKSPANEDNSCKGVEKVACVAYCRLVDLYKRRNKCIDELAKDNATTTTAVLKILDDEITSIEELFGVTITTTKHTVQRSFIPKPEKASETFYVTNKGELEPERTDEPKPKKPRLTLKVVAKTPSSAQAKPVFSRKCGAKRGDGLVYRLPESGMAYVTREPRNENDEQKILASERVNLPQFGRFVSLPNCFSKRKTVLDVNLHANTGMLQTISLTEQALPEEAEVFQQNLDALETASDALGKAVAKAGAEDRELEALKKEKELLEAEKEKLELERQINCLKETGKPCLEE